MSTNDGSTISTRANSLAVSRLTYRRNCKTYTSPDPELAESVITHNEKRSSRIDTVNRSATENNEAPSDSNSTKDDSGSVEREQSADMFADYLEDLAQDDISIHTKNDGEENNCKNSIVSQEQVVPTNERLVEDSSSKVRTNVDTTENFRKSAERKSENDFCGCGNVHLFESASEQSLDDYSTKGNKRSSEDSKKKSKRNKRAATK